MSTEERFERLLSELLDEDTPTRAPDRLLPETQRALRHVHRWPRWLALLKESPMRISSRVAVGSPMARVAAIAVATLLLAVMATGAVIGGSQLLAGPGVIVVAQDGSGDFATITEAVEAAEDGHTILLQPGTYIEAITISEDLHLTGDAEDPSTVVIQAPPDGPTFFADDWQMPYSLLLVDTDSTVSDLTIRGTDSSVIVHGGAPTLEGLVLNGVGCSYGGDLDCDGGDGVLIQAGSRATLTGNALLGGGSIGISDASEPLIEGNTLSGGPHIWGWPGDEAVVRDNTISGTFKRAVWVGGPSTVTIEGNTITDSAGNGITVGSGAGDTDMNATVRENDISGVNVGISIATDGAHPTIEGNELSGNTTGILVHRTDATVANNFIHGNKSGIAIDRSSPNLENNSIVDNGVGLAILSVSARPTLLGNEICGNETNFRLMRNVEMPATDGNDICPDSLATVSE